MQLHCKSGDDKWKRFCCCFFSHQKCVKDTLSAVVIKLKFSQNSTTPPTGILNVDSPTQASIEVLHKAPIQFHLINIPIVPDTVR